MSKVSKNIKKIRTEKGMTQETLAEKIFVTRQAISNWETGRTKPDVDSLLKIAEILDVQVEELIYGERKEKIAVEDKTREKNRIKVILAIMGSLFLGVGLALIFFEFWKDFSMIIKTVFALLPALAGQLICLFVTQKKKNSIAWRESAGILWTLGTVATVALINEIFSINCGYINCMVIDVILVALIMFAMKTVSPLAFYYYMTIHISTEGRGEYFLFGLIFFLLGVVFNVIVARKKDDARGIFTQWITTVASIPMLVVLSAVFDGKDIFCEVFFIMLLAYCLCTYILSAKNKTFTLPYRPISILGVSVAMFVASMSVGICAKNVTLFILFFLVCLGLPVLCLVMRRKEFTKSIPDLISAVVPIVFMAVECILSAISDYCEHWIYHFSMVYIVFSAFIFLYGLTLVVIGIKEIKLYHIDVGLLLIFAQIMYLCSDVYYGSYIYFGITFAIFGTIILLINGTVFALIRRRKRVDGGVDDEK